MTILIEALIDTAKMIPFLLAAYFFIAFLERRYGDRMGRYVTKVGRAGPVIGALAGCFPQCGFSVLAAALYTKRLISGGTLLAVFLATSDEAIPILFALPGKAAMVLPLLLLKAVIAIVSGMIFDMIFRRSPGASAPPLRASVVEQERDAALHHAACCDHEVSDRPSKLRSLVRHPIEHTLKVFLYLLILTVGINFVLDHLGPERVASLLKHGSVFQPSIASLIGLIPNCFASVALAELYAEGVLSFGALVSGLCAGAGLGLIVLIRENKNWKNTLLVLGTLLGVSIVWGTFIQVLPLMP